MRFGREVESNSFPACSATDFGPVKSIGTNNDLARAALLSLSLLLLLAEAPKVNANVETPPGPEKSAAVSREETGFEFLFSDAALKQWRQCGPGRFIVSKGVATGEGGMGLWWYSGKQFTNFILRGEFVQEQEIADSGVFLRFPDPKDDPWNAVHQGHEMEIGDPNPKDPTWRTGSIYPFKASIKANTKPVGQWNEYEITCIGQDYSVRMNGELVMTWTDPKQRSRSGYIGLQNYNDGKTVRHRNVRIKELPLNK